MTSAPVATLGVLADVQSGDKDDGKKKPAGKAKGKKPAAKKK